MKHKARKTAVSLVGFTVLILGIIMIPYPGPGWLTVFLGLGILSTEYDWAKQVLDFVKKKYDAWEDWVSKQGTLVKSALWLMTALVVVLTLWLLNAYGLMNAVLHLGWDWLRSPLPIFH